MAHLLLIDDDADAEAVSAALSQRGHEVRWARSAASGLEQFHKDRADVVIVNTELPDGKGQDVLTRVRVEDPTTMVVLISTTGTIEVAVDAMKQGASDFVRKPLDVPDLELRVSRALSSRRLATQLGYLKARQARGADISGLVGDCPSMRSVFDTVIRLGQKTTRRAGPTVLIVGETGTGKGVMARALHYNSQRREGPFVEVNCASIPENLMEAEVFGAERGAYTGAVASHVGYVETADGGTLFLDEIGCLSLPLQAKLLTVLESRTFRRVGSSVERHADVQVVVATNMDLRAAVERGAFREDLMHRLEIIVIKMPPLRERGPDRMELAAHLRDEICRDYGLPARLFADDVDDLIERYQWPGNVRELRNCLEQILLLEDDPIIFARHFHLRGKMKRASASRLAVTGAGVELEMPADGIALQTVEDALIDRSLEMCDGNVSRAARMLGVSRDQLRYRLAKRGG
ncbi:MAG: sigma-54-dependent Fis family transcriptional regulator [Deltaproteobacteria bacterium]|nr:sigma-54-dependent Fis family transcriptional regulator [Deltaproteobacteria bacterium]